MKVKCVKNKLSDIDNSELLDLVKKNISCPDEDSSLNLKIGREYLVYGITLRDNIPLYYLLDNDEDDYPTPLPAVFFEISDDRLSKHWALFYEFGSFGASTDLLVREWGEDENFYWNLVEGEEEEIEKFKNIRKLVENEF